MQPKKTLRLLALSLFTLALLPAVGFACAAHGDAVAKVGTRVVTLEQAEALAQTELANLERQRHQILEQAVDAAVAEELFALEAESRGLPLDSILAEIEAQVGEVPESEIDLWYQRNQARVRQPKEQIAGQIRAFLEAQRRQTVRTERIAKLREKFPVEVLLEPFRLDLDLGAFPSRGKDDAPVTVVEYGDFQCPPCGRLFTDIKDLKQEYGDQVRFVFVHNPLESIHPEARGASAAAFCAGEQDRFWEMHDALFTDQRNLDVASLHQKAADLGLDGEAFASCLDSERADAAVDAGLESGRLAGVSGTPTLFVNGRPVAIRSVASAAQDVESVIVEELGLLAPNEPESGEPGESAAAAGR